MNRFCKDCKWAKKKWYQQWWEARCYHPKAYSTSTDFVTGKVKIDANRCFSERLQNVGKCKEAGELFESR
jgi:hypothetical protein